MDVVFRSSEADPELLANYVGALLKNEKPLDQLKILCLEQLTEFLNEGTSSSDSAGVFQQRGNESISWLCRYGDLREHTVRSFGIGNRAA